VKKKDIRKFLDGIYVSEKSTIDEWDWTFVTDIDLKCSNGTEHVHVRFIACALQCEYASAIWLNKILWVMQALQCPFHYDEDVISVTQSTAVYR